MELHSIYKKIKHSSVAETGAYRAISLYVLDNINKLSELSIKKISANCGISDATIVRYCKDLGFHGFFDFRKSLEEIQHNYIFNRHEILLKKEFGDDLKVFYEKYLSILDEGRKSIFHIIESGLLHHAALLLCSAKNIYMAGQNINYHQSLDFKNKMIGYGKSIFVDNDLHALATFANICGQNDVFITVSLSGKNASIIKLGEIAHLNGAKWIHIGSSIKIETQNNVTPNVTLEITSEENDLWNLYSLRGALLFELENLLFLEVTMCNPKYK